MILELQGELSSREKRWSLNGTTALVTGGRRGTGYAVVEELAAFGVSIYTYSRNQTELKEKLQEWKDKGCNVSGSTCDLVSRPQRGKLMKQVSSVFDGKLNILVNNAGIAILAQAQEYSGEAFSKLMGTNLEASFPLSQLAHPLLKASGNGNIVFMSSVAGTIALPLLSVYAATKGAINQVTRNMACEWARDSIRVNAIAPWIIKSPILDTLEETLYKDYIDRSPCFNPIPRIGRPEEVSGLLAFLCLPAASYITSQFIHVDGCFSVNGFYMTQD